MTYSYNFVLKKTGRAEYIIVSDKGFTMHTLDRCDSVDEAMTRARAWASSWNSVIIRMEDEKK